MPWIIGVKIYELKYSLDTEILYLYFQQLSWTWSGVKSVDTVKAIFKKSNSIIDNLNNNLRTISLTSVPLKVSESALCPRFTDFFEVFSLLSTTQSSFRANFTTTTTIGSMVYDLVDMDYFQIISITLLDYRKLFIVNFCCLLFKLHCCGVREQLLHWFESYLLNRY